MKIGKYDVPLFEDFGAAKTIELLEGKSTRQVFFGENILVVRNVVRDDVVMPEHSHPHEQLTYVSAGECEVTIEGEEPKHMQAGEICLFPSGRKHALVCKAGTIIWDIFTPLRDDIIESVLG